jgi:hypothetical protein
VEKLLNFCDQYDGYCFHPYQTQFLDDLQTKPSEPTLKYIEVSDDANSLLQRLLSNDDATVECIHGLRTTFSLEDTRAMTYAGDRRFKIPNRDAKVDYIQAASRMQLWSQICSVNRSVFFVI